MSLTCKAHQFIQRQFRVLDFAIDATCGNGNDTLFLAKLRSENGVILGFDIQQEAIENTNLLLSMNNLKKNVHLINNTHENMDKYINHESDVIMFNLGYLPGSDSSISTSAKSTLKALNYSKEVIKTGGLITVVCYPGHRAGKKETQEVNIWVSRLGNQYQISKFLSENPGENTPILFVIEKLF